MVAHSERRAQETVAYPEAVTDVGSNGLWWNDDIADFVNAGDGQTAGPFAGPTTIILGGPPWRWRRRKLARLWRLGARQFVLFLGPLRVKVPVDFLLSLRAAIAVVRSRMAARGIALEPTWLRTRRHLERYALIKADVASQMIPSERARGIVLVCGNLSPGGAERQVVNTAVGLQQAGLDVRVLAHSLSAAGRADFHLPTLERYGVAVREVRRGIAAHGIRQALRTGGLQAIADDVADLVAEFREIGPEIVHAWLDWDNVRAGLAAVYAGVPRIVLSGRNLAPVNFELYQSYMDAAYRFLVRQPNVVLLNNSQAGAFSYADWIGIPRTDVRVVRNGWRFEPKADRAETNRAATRARLAIGPDALVVGGVFRFESEKRPLLWVETAAQIARAQPNTRFVLFGQGRLREACERRAKDLGIAEMVTFAGVTDDPLSAMAAMDVFLLTSKGEGLPNVLIEAQSVGVPVVCADAGGAREAVRDGETGTVVDVADAVQVSRAVLAWLDAPERRAHVRILGPSFVGAEFGMGRMIAETIDVYGLSVRAGRSDGGAGA